MSVDLHNQTVENIEKLIDLENKTIKTLKKIRYALNEKAKYIQDTLWYYKYPKSQLTKLMIKDAEDYKEIFGEFPVWYRNTPTTYAMIDWIAIQHGKWNKAHGIEWHKAILTCKVCNTIFPTEPAHDRYHQSAHFLGEIKIEV